jgi:hypothetical protein
MKVMSAQHVPQRRRPAGTGWQDGEEEDREQGLSRLIAMPVRMTRRPDLAPSSSGTRATVSRRVCQAIRAGTTRYFTVSKAAPLPCSKAAKAVIAAARCGGIPRVREAAGRRPGGARARCQRVERPVGVSVTSEVIKRLAIS